MPKLKKLLLIAIAGIVVAIPTMGAVYWQYSSGVTPTGPEVIAPVHQSGSDVAITVTQLANGIANILAPLSVPNGGTGNNTNTAHAVMIGENTSPVNFQGPGTSGQCLTSNGASSDPTFQGCAGRLINIQTFSSTGTYTPTSGTTAVIVKLCAGGGGGKGAPATTAGQYSSGGGGAAGGIAVSYLTSGFSGVTVTIGTGGGAGVGGNNSSFGAVMSASGGSAGNNSAAATVVTLSTPGTGGGGASGNLFNGNGGDGTFGLVIPGQGQALSGAGGTSAFGMGGSAIGAGTGNGLAGSSPCSGGSGGANGPSSAATAGGAGANGFALIYEYQ